MQIRQIFISEGHNYFGHHGRAPDDHPLVEVPRIECVAGHGIRERLAHAAKEPVMVEEDDVDADARVARRPLLRLPG